MRPSRFHLNARYRYTDVDVQTPNSIAHRPRCLRLDLSKPAAASEYHSVTRSTFDVEGAVSVSRYTSLKAGYSQHGTDYTHRIWESTNEDVFRLSLDRTGTSASCCARTMRIASAPARLRRRRTRRSGRTADDAAFRHRRSGPHPFHLHWHGQVTTIIEVNASAGVGRDEYTDSGHGLQSFDSNDIRSAPTSRRTTALPERELRLGGLFLAAAFAQRQRRGPAGRPTTRLDHGLHR